MAFDQTNCKLWKCQSDDLINAKKPSPMTSAAIRSWELGLQMVNHKKLTDFYQPNQMNSDCTFR